MSYQLTSIALQLIENGGKSIKNKRKAGDTSPAL